MVDNSGKSLNFAADRMHSANSKANFLCACLHYQSKQSSYGIKIISYRNPNI